MWWQS